MANLGFTLDDSTLPEVDYKAIPEGWYDSTITMASLETSKNGGEYIKLIHSITGPDHAGRVLFNNVTIKYSDPEVERIGRETIQRIRIAGNLPPIKDTDQLIGTNVQIKVRKIKDENYGDSDGMKNEVKGYRAIKGSVPPRPAQSSIPSFAQPESPVQQNKKPWEK